MKETVPAVAALTIDGCPVQKIGGDYVMLYPWISCHPLMPPRLTARHTAVVGDLLARMHTTGKALFDARLIPLPETDGDPGIRDWEALFREAEAAAPLAPWLEDLRASLPALCAAEEGIRSARAALPATVLSPRALDPKNVLWDGLSPFVIDWESAGEINPASELLEALLSWSDSGAGGTDEGLFRSLLDAYRAVLVDNDEPWEAVFAASPDGLTDWLAYNVRRAAGIEAADAHDRRIGASEVAGTLRTLAARRAILPVVREWMGV